MTAIKHTDIPQQQQRQDALLDQLGDLYCWAVRLGMNDAADWLWDRRPTDDGSEAAS